jgi:type IV pilus biogenesis protein PilP
MKKTLLRGAALALLPSIALADPSSDVQKLTALHNQVAILTQQLAVARLQAQIAQQGGASSSASPVGASAPGVPAQNLASAAPLPTIISIVGSGIHLTATLQTQSGTELVVAPGQALPGGLTIYRITENGVSVLQAGNIIPLPFAGDTPSTASSTPAATPATTMLPRIIPPPPPNPPSMTSSTLPGSN